MYRRWPQALVAAGPVALAGCRVLDLGAGTGAAGRAALAAGARGVVAADVAVGMLRRCGPRVAPGRGRRGRAAVPRPQLRPRARRVLPRPPARPGRRACARPAGSARRSRPARSRPAGPPGQGGGGGGAASVRLPAPRLVPAVQARDRTARLATRSVLAARLAAAGFGQVRIRPVTSGRGFPRPAELAAWRLGMAHVAPVHPRCPRVTRPPPGKPRSELWPNRRRNRSRSRCW